MPYIKKTLVESDAAIAVSRALRDRLMRYCPGRDIHVVGNVVDTAFFGLAPQNRGHSEFTFLAIAALNENKGIDVLIRAFAQAFSHLDGVRLVIGGDGPARSGLELLTLDLGLSDRVKFLGMLSRESVRDTLWEGDTLVLASHIETFGVILIEAMSTGLPVIATSCGGPEDFVLPHVGSLVPPGDVNGLSLALIAAVENPGRFDRQTVRNYVQENFSENAVVEKLAEVYRKVSHV
jgi:glycosyltransferase involved in cell wall biosynthesis